MLRMLVNKKQCKLSNLESTEQLFCHWHNQILCNEIIAADLGIVSCPISIVVSLHTQLASMTIDGYSGAWAGATEGSGPLVKGRWVGRGAAWGGRENLRFCPTNASGSAP